MLRSKPSTSSAYRPDIDGLRAIAVLAVVLFHAKVPGFSGGYVGVDIFFVISGYLITKVIEAEMNQERFTFLGFYERRVRRIFPALIVVLLVTTAFGFFAFPQQQFAQFGKSLLAVAGFVSNLFFRTTSREGGYFADGSGEQFLLHTWSLSVEEQFYLFFPVLLLLLHRFGRRPKQALIILGAIASFAASVYTLRTQPTAAFYLLPGRAWELLLGALVAYKTFPTLQHAWLRSIVGAAGLILMVWSITTFTDTTPFPGPSALAPVVGAALLIYAGETGGSATRSLMSFQPLVWVGLISYSLYLWHWPLIAATRWYYAAYSLEWRSYIPALALSLVLAILSYLFVETPFRKRRDVATKRHTAVAWGLLANAAVALLAATLILSHGLPRRFRPSKGDAMETNFDRKSQHFVVTACDNEVAPGERFDHPTFCSHFHAAHNVLVFGDSHAGQLVPLFDRMATSGAFGGEGVVYAISAGCTIGTAITRAMPGLRCDRFTTQALARAAQPDIDTVFIIFNPWWTLVPSTCVPSGEACGPLLSGPDAWKVFRSQLEQEVQGLQSLGKHVILTVPFPNYDHVLPDMMIRNLALGHWRTLQVYPAELIPPAELNDIRRLAASTGVTIYDPRALLCPADKCMYEQNSISLYSDQSHLATTVLDQFRPGILAAWQSAKAAAPHSSAVGQTNRGASVGPGKNLWPA